MSTALANTFALPEHLRLTSDAVILDRSCPGTPHFEERLTDIEHMVGSIRALHDAARSEDTGCPQPRLHQQPPGL